MIYLIAQNKTSIENANLQISQNMGLGDGVTSSWDEPKQVNAPSGDGMDAISAHPVYMIDPTKENWWSIVKPEERFMVGVILQEIEA